jgi:hypothetical protein
MKNNSTGHKRRDLSKEGLRAILDPCDTTRVKDTCPYHNPLHITFATPHVGVAFLSESVARRSGIACPALTF